MQESENVWSETQKLTHISENENGYVLSRGGWMFFASKKLMGNVVPKVGDEVQLSMTKSAYIRGLKLNGKEIYFKTDKQIQQERIDKLQKIKEETHAAFIAYEKHATRDYNSLHKCLRAEIDDLRAQGQEQREQWEPEVMFTLTEAMKIANTLKTPEAVKAFWNATYEKKQELVPTLSDDHFAHHTLELACASAYQVAKERQKEVFIAHELLNRSRG